MITVAVDENNDMFLDSGNIAMARDIDAIMQICEQVSKTLTGELRYNKTKGIPYADCVWSNVDLNVFKDAVRFAIEAVAGVLAVNTFDIQQDGNVTKYRIGISTIYGEDAINGQL